MTCSGLFGYSLFIPASASRANAEACFRDMPVSVLPHAFVEAWSVPVRGKGLPWPPEEISCRVLFSRVVNRASNSQPS